MLGACRSARARRGGVLVFVAIAMGVLMGIAGLVVDGGNLFLIRQKLQSGADAAALAAALAIPNVQAMNEKANLLMNLNSPGGKGVQVTVLPNYQGNPSKVEIVTQAWYSPCLLGMIGVGDVRIGVRAVAENAGPVPTQWNPFDFDGVVGRDSVSFNGGAWIDSFDSAAGPYGGSNVYQTGNVMTNGSFSMQGNGDIRGTLTNQGAVTLGGNAVVKAVVAGSNVTMGGNSEVTTTLSTNGTLSNDNGGTVLGQITQNAGLSIPSISLPPLSIDMSAAQTSNNNGAIPSSARNNGNPPALEVGGNTDVTLPPGTYYVSSVSITGNGQLRISGQTKIYVTGDVSIGGNGMLNGQQMPNNLQIYSSGTNVSFSGNGDFSGGVYAPNATLSVQGNGEVFGAYVARNINLGGNGNIHLDRNMQGSVTTQGSPGIFRLTE